MVSLRALFPAKGALRLVMALNPLTYGLAGLRRSMYFGSPVAGLPGWTACIGVTLLFAVVMALLAAAISGGRVAADLQ